MTQNPPEGFLATPPSGTGPGVIVLHAWWGLNATIKATCSRLAENGYITFAPDLYHGKVADTIPEAEKLGKALDGNYLQARAEIAQACSFLSEHVGQSRHDLAVIGFSLGAFYALDLAIQDAENIRSVVLFYGTGGGDFDKSKASFLGHFAENDPFEPPTNVNQLEESLKNSGHQVTFYRYPGTGHWFFEPDRIDAYNQGAANLAWERTIKYLADEFKVRE